MPAIDLTETISRAEAAVTPCLAQTLEAISRRRPPFETVSLTVDFKNTHLPNVGTISVPVTISLGEDAGSPLRLSIIIRAAHGQALFPVFHGIISARSIGATKTEIFLSGNYDAPGGRLGAGIDHVVFNGAATAILRAFLRWVAKTVTTNLN